MKCKLTPIVYYAVEVDGIDLGKFKVGEEWKGFASLESTEGEIIVKVEPSNVFATMFESKVERTGEVVSITPELLKKVNLERIHPK